MLKSAPAVPITGEIQVHSPQTESMSEHALQRENPTGPETCEPDVEGWRFDVLIRAGYPPRLAHALARSGADLHLAAELVARGCEPQLAARILL